MKPEPAPATSDLMALICLIGGAVREAGPLGLLVKLLLISAYCPPLRTALLAWISAEERYASSEFEYELYSEEDGEGGEDEIRPGWRSLEGPVQFWRHVTRFGFALLIPIQVGVTRAVVGFTSPSDILVRVRVLISLSLCLFLRPVEAQRRTVSISLR